jgi:hypothetical protein
MLLCRTCKTLKAPTVENFPKHHSTKSGFDTECKDCVSIRRKIYYEENKKSILEKRRIYRNKNLTKVLASNKSYGVRNKEKRRVGAIWCSYKVDESFIRDIMDSQKGCCGICKQSLILPGDKKSYSIDHNHLTGKVRGLLCHHCNAAIGLFKEDESNLLGAIEYLRYHNGE